MSDINEIDAEIQQRAQEYDLRSNEYRMICDEATNKRHIYDLAKAKAMLSAPVEYKVDEKKAFVVQACQQQALECHLAESTRDWYKERLRALGSLLTAAQSRARIVGEDLRLTNVRY